MSECFILCCVCSTKENQTWKKQSLEIYHNEKQNFLWSNESRYDNVNFLQKKKKLAGEGFCRGKIFSRNNKKFSHERSLLLEQVTFRWDDDDICFVLDQHTEFDFLLY